MTSEKSDPEACSQPNAATLRVQREANEKLLLAVVQAEDYADSARGAHLLAEAEAEQLRGEAGELRTSAQFRERLIGIIGHDLRNPLNSMVMAGSLLRDDASASDETRRMGERIVHSGSRMGRMIDELVDFTRMRLGGDLPLDLVLLDLSEVCLNVVEEFRVVGRRPIVFMPLAGVSGRWDRDRLSQVASNLLGNAVEHAAPGSKVSVEVRGEDDCGVLEFINRGPTIPPHVLPFIFDAFRRATDGPAGKHLGLGLYIVDQIVRAHRGTIKVRSANSTTTFTVRLPRALPH